MQNSKNLPYMHGFACIVGIFTYRKRKVLWEKKTRQRFCHELTKRAQEEV